MADRWLFAGGGIESLRTVSGTPTTASGHNGSYADHAVQCSSSKIVAADFVDSSVASDAAVTGEKLYFRFSTQITGTASVGNFVELVDGSDLPWLAVRNVGGSGTSCTWQLYYNSNTGASPTWTAVTADTIIVNSGSPRECCIWITLGSPHIAGISFEGSFVGEGSFTQASLTSLDAAKLRGPQTSDQRFSEVAAAVGINLVGSHVFYGKATGAGASSAWSGTTGTFADIDDAGINDADSLSSATAAQRHTFAYSNPPALGANEALGDVFLWTRARNSGGAPSNIKPVRRDSGGTDNVGSSFSGITGAYQSFLTRYSGLSETEFNASEFGVESAT